MESGQHKTLTKKEHLFFVRQEGINSLFWLMKMRRLFPEIFPKFLAYSNAVEKSKVIHFPMIITAGR
jgi:hypothetical protein